MNLLEELFDEDKTPPHYDLTIQPIELMDSWMSREERYGFYFGNVLKYIGRHQHKGTTLEDLRKAKYYLEKMIECQQ